MKIVVGSKNPAKVKAVQLAVDRIYPGVKVDFLEVESGVSAQPLSEEEAIKGAKNRAKTVQEKTQADFGVGLEGGINQIGGSWYGGSWVAVYSKDKFFGLGSSARFELSEKLSKLILSGKEMSEVIDKLSGKTDIRSNEGAMGVITNNHLNRAEAYSHGVLFAFGPFISDKVFWE